MGDCYHAVFRRLVGRTGPRAEVPIPPSLRLVYGVCSVLALLGWLLVVGFGKSTPLTDNAPWLVLFYFTFPIWVVLYLGFSEQQSWTRPLMIALLIASTALSWIFDFVLLSAGLAVLTLLAAGYLYRSPTIRRYYADCHRHALIHLDAADLRSAAFIPLYTSIAGVILGASLTFWLIWRQPAESAAELRDFAGTACASILAGVIVGVLGRWLGEAIVSRFCRPARPGSAGDGQTRSPG